MFENFLNFVGSEDPEHIADGIGIDLDGDGIIDGIDLDGDGTIDIFGLDTDDDGSLDMFMQQADTDGDGIEDTAFLYIDSDGDKQIDQLVVQHTEVLDTDNDGNADMLVMQTYTDSDLNGVWDSVQTEAASDSDGNGIFDTFYTQTAVDSDQDGQLDRFFTQTDVDFNEDGIMDVSQMEISEDTDGDGTEDYIFTGTDYTGDGVFDEVFEVGAPSTFMVELMTAEAPSYDTFDPDAANMDMVIGDPAEASEHWHIQQTSSTCAVASQEFVLEELTGKEFSEKELTAIAETNGWYDDGTPFECVGNLIEYMGHHTERSTGNNIHDIEKCLANGGQVIVGVDSDELWNGESNDFFGPGMDANHAIQVTGVNYTDPHHPTVIINDSGVKNGCAAEIPLNDFMEAWEDSGYYMVEAYL